MQSSPTKRIWLSALLLSVLSGPGLARAQTAPRIENWTVPEWSSKAVDISRPVTFVAVTPCRIVDTRDPAGPYGGPILPPNTVRDFDLNSGPCPQIPNELAAYSLNFTATQTQGFGDLRFWPAGSTPPLVSTLNYVPNQTVANAAIVPAGTSGSISVVAAVSGTHLIIDINGYFTDQPNQGNGWYFRVSNPQQAALTVVNHEAAATVTSGLFALTSSVGSLSYGVIGLNQGFNAASETGGILGLTENGLNLPLYGQAAVRGQSFASFGVLGVSYGGLGVAGSNVTNGVEQTWAGLACSDTVAVCGSGTVNVSGVVASLEPHATDAARVVKYAALEGPEAGTYFRGRGKFERGLARIRVPDDFRMVTDPEGLSVQVTPIGEMASFAVVRIDLEEIVVKASRNVEFFYTVNGLRRGYEDFTPIVEEAFFVPRSADYRMPGGLSAEAKRKLIANGTYNADGTVNMETAERLGWKTKWQIAGAKEGK